MKARSSFHSDLTTAGHHMWYVYLLLYRVIQKSLQDFLPLRYSSRNGNAEGEHVNRGRERHSKFLSYLTGARYVHPWWRGRCQLLANSKTQNGFLFPVHAMFPHDCLLAVETSKYATAPNTHKKLGEILYILICSFLLCLSWLLHSRVRKFRRDLWITLYVEIVIDGTSSSAYALEVWKEQWLWYFSL